MRCLNPKYDSPKIAADSSFIEGSSYQYKSGIVTDSAIESGEKALFNVSIETSDTTKVEYITKEIHFNIETIEIEMIIEEEADIGEDEV